MSDIAIHVEGLSKQYRRGGKEEPYKTLRGTIVDALASPFRRAGKLLRGQATGAAELDEQFWALKDLSFDIKQGEVLGIIGPNGAGKSTVLKIFSRITEPTSGFVEVRGRVASLLEVGTGFHPELTGRENIYLNGAILGMRRAEINRKFDEIVSFAEVEQFIDTPVKHYSSGMYLRLAFAVAAHLEPEVLLVDEVLAVGDAAFQRKCLGRMGAVAKEGRTVLLVSHNMSAIAQLCGNALWLDKGELKLRGPSSEVIRSYLASGTTTHPTWTCPPDAQSRTGVQMKSVRILSSDDRPSAVFRYDEDFTVEIKYRINSSTRNLFVICRLSDLQGNIVWSSWDTDTTDWSDRVRKPGLYASTCAIPGSLLRPGRYLITAGIENTKSRMDWYENVLGFDVSELGFPFNIDRLGVITPPLKWDVREISA